MNDENSIILSVPRASITLATRTLYTYGDGYSSTGLGDFLSERLLSPTGAELSAGQFALPLDKGKRR